MPGWKVLIGSVTISVDQVHIGTIIDQFIKERLSTDTVNEFRPHQDVKQCVAVRVSTVDL